MQLDEQSVDTWPEPFHWRHWVGEELHEVRVTCNEQDVLETVEKQSVSSNTVKQARLYSKQQHFGISKCCKKIQKERNLWLYLHKSAALLVYCLASDSAFSAAE